MDVSVCGIIHTTRLIHLRTTDRLWCDGELEGLPRPSKRNQMKGRVVKVGTNNMHLY